MGYNDKVINFHSTYRALGISDTLGDDHISIAKAYDNLIEDYQKSRELNTELMEYLKEYKKIDFTVN